MKKLVVLLILPLLTACPGGGGSGGDVKITTELAPEAPEVTTTTIPVTTTTLAPATTTTTTTQAPALDYSQLEGKSLIQANGQVVVSNGRVLDTRCGYNYAVTSHSSVAGVVTIVTDYAVEADYTQPSHEDCIIYPTYNTSNKKLTDACPYNGVFVNLTTNTKNAAAHVEYRIEYVNGGYQIDRQLRTRTWWSTCGTGNVPVNFSVTFPTEIYNE